MKVLLGSLMLANAALFLFGAVQHAGMDIGPFHEPLIVPAAIVESVCAAALLWGGEAVWRGRPRAWGVALIANLIAFSGVAIGIVELAKGAGPRTASNDFYHMVMLSLIAGCVLALASRPGRAALRHGGK